MAKVARVTSFPRRVTGSARVRTLTARSRKDRIRQRLEGEGIE
jgi:hypothetical protein